MNPTYHLTTTRTYLILNVLSLMHLSQCTTQHDQHTNRHHQQPRENTQHTNQPLECGEYDGKVSVKTHRNKLEENMENAISPGQTQLKKNHQHSAGANTGKVSADEKIHPRVDKKPPSLHKNGSQGIPKPSKKPKPSVSTKRKPYGKLAAGVYDTEEKTDKPSKSTRSLFSGLNITLFDTLLSTKEKKKKHTNMFGYEDYSSMTMESIYYDATKDDFNIQDYETFNFSTKYGNVRDMYRENKWLRYINRGEARMIETELKDRFGYTIDQIAELSGLSVARAIERHYKKDNYSDVLVMCGSGNNGLYGMVTARHLKLMGYDPTIFLVNQYNSSRPDGHTLFTQLKKQVLAFNIPILSSLPSNVTVLTSVHKLIVDAIFGVGYDRTMYDKLPRANRYKYSVNLLRQINKLKTKPKTPIVSIDLPSGWDTNIGNYEGYHINPELLVSLIAPKLGVVEFFGKYHYIAGNFLPPILNEKYQVYVPEYNGSDCLVPVETLVMEDTTETAEMLHMK
uniref:NAD(P)H-hydrate epimerase n=1 Tax=Cacopsylla melanoneura TaxID=428564 RepID=A0A8D8VKW1_9HEMI